MKFGRSLLPAMVLGLLLASCSSGGDSSGTSRSTGSNSTGDFTPVIARVGDVEITQGYFDERYRQLSPSSQARFTGEDWRERFLDQLVEETLLYNQALAEEYENSPTVEAALEAARRSILVDAYTDNIQNTAMPFDEEVVEHWEFRKEDYKELDRVLVSHVRCSDEGKIRRAYDRLVAGDTFEKVAWEFDEDPNSRANKGLIGWINPGGFILGVGYNQQYTDIAFDLGYQQYSEPVKIGDFWFIIRAGTKVEGKMPTFEEARDDVVEDIRPRAVRREYERVLAELEDRYPVRFYGEFQVETPRTAEQLYKLAAEARNPYARVNYYAQLADQYPESEYADDALFMLGFLWSEELVDAPWASSYLKRLIEEYPESPYLEDAQWLRGNLSGSVQGLRQAGAANADQLQKNMGSFRGN